MSPSFVAHVLPVEHAGDADAVLTLALLTIGVLFTLAAGLILSNAARRRHVQRPLLAAFAAGLLAFLLFDLLKESASLGQALLRTPSLMVALVVAFSIGALVVGGSRTQPAPLWTAWLWSLGIGLHGAAEGWVVGTEAATAALSPTGTLSFLLHKMLEGVTIPIVAAVTLQRRELALMPAFIAVITLLGAVAGVLVGPSVLPLLLFSAGAGATAVALLYAARAITPSRASTIMMVLGVVTIYAAGLLHEL